MELTKNAYEFAIDPYIAELGRDGWKFGAVVEATGEYAELSCPALPTVVAMLGDAQAGAEAAIEAGRDALAEEVADSVESAAFEREVEVDYDALIEGVWDVVADILEEAEEISK